MTLAKNVSIFFRADTKAFQTGLDKMQRSITKFSRQTKKLGKSITRNFSIPFALAAGSAVKMVTDFDLSMTKLNTLVGISEGEIEKFKDSVLELSGEVAQSPNALAEGLYFLTSAGLRGANAMETLEAVAKGVAIGLGEQTDLAKVAGAAQNAYGKDVLSSAEALDVFGAMVKTGMFESSELAAVLGKEAGFAASLGISFQEMGAFISTYTTVTGDATSATTGMSGVLMAFTKETDKGRNALSKINMSYADLRTMLGEQGLQNTLIHLKANFEANGVQMSEFFSKSQALKSVVTVLGNQTGTYVNILGELEGATGMVSNGFDILSQKAGFKLQKAWNDMKLAMMSFGVVLVPIMETFAGFISMISQKFMELGDTTKTVFGYVGTALAVSGPILIGLAAVSKGISMAIGGVKLLLNAFIVLSKNPALIAIAVAMGLAMTMINSTTSAINEQGKTIVKLTEGAKAWRRMWGFVRFLVDMVGQTIYDISILLGGIAVILGQAATLHFDAAGKSVEKLEAMMTSNKYGRKLFDYSDSGANFDKIMEEVESGIEKTEFELNQPDPPSAEELMNEFQNDLNKFKPTIQNVELGDGDGSGIGGVKTWTQDDFTKWLDMPNKEDMQKAVDYLAPTMPSIDTSEIRSGLEEHYQLWLENTTGIVMVTSEGGQKIVENFEEVNNTLLQFQQQIADSLASGIGNAFASAVVDGENFGESMMNVFKNLIKQIMVAIIKQQILNSLMKSTGVGKVGGFVSSLANLITPANDIAFGPSAGRYITGPEGMFSLNPRDSIVAGTDLFGGDQGAKNMTVNGYIDGSSIFLSNTRQTNTVNRLS